MADRLRRVAVLTNLLPETTDKALVELAECRAKLGLDLLLLPEERAKHSAWRELGYQAIADDELRTADVCLVLGGDGTILRALGRLVGSGVPTLGINFGAVGFLATLRPDDWSAGLAAIVAGRYEVVDLMTVEVTHQDRLYAGVNDIVLSRAEPRGVLKISYAISGTHVGEMLCDGMIIASPGGSTAYNLSCEGPLVVWDARVLVLNFIAPHSLGFRPVVLRPDHVITACNVSDIDEADIVVDGEVVGRLRCGEQIEVSAGRQVARLMVREGGSFYQHVEEKLFHRTVHAR
jgi:NAD+ kinase